MAWTLLAPYVASCPKNNPRIEWQNFPALAVVNNPQSNSTPAITHDLVLSHPGQEINLTWASPGGCVGPNGTYKTSTSAKGGPKV